MVTLEILLGLLLLYIAYSLTKITNIVNDVGSSKLYVVGYYRYGENGIVQCKTMNGKAVTLIDKNYLHQAELTCLNGTDPQWIHFHVELIWDIFFRFEIYVDGIQR